MGHEPSQDEEVVRHGRTFVVCHALVVVCFVVGGLSSVWDNVLALHSFSTGLRRWNSLYFVEVGD